MHDAPSMRMGLATAILTLTECETMTASKRQEGERKTDNESSWYRRDFAGGLDAAFSSKGSSVATQTTRQLPPPINTKAA